MTNSPNMYASKNPVIAAAKAGKVQTFLGVTTPSPQLAQMLALSGFDGIMIDMEHGPIDNGLEVPPNLIDHNGGIEVLAPAGSIFIFHVLLIHNSKPNVSGRPRRLMIYSHFPKAANKGNDVRNGPGRLLESPWEWEYQRKKERGEFVDEFEAPSFS